MQISIEGLLSRAPRTNTRLLALERFLGMRLPFLKHREPRPQWIDIPPLAA